MKKLNIAIIGYGRMGKLVAEAATKRGHVIRAMIDSSEEWNSFKSAPPECDVAIDFSNPEAAVQNIIDCFEMRLPVVQGTTGWYEQLPSIISHCEQLNGSLFYAPNFSIGMNAVFALSEQLSRMLANAGYSFAIEEVHHVHKLDAPSGTAIQLAERIIRHQPEIEKWELTENVSNTEKVLPVHVERKGEVAGYHAVTASSVADVIKLSHNALNREGFANGAVLAAEFLAEKRGVYTMSDLLKF